MVTPGEMLPGRVAKPGLVMSPGVVNPARGEVLVTVTNFADEPRRVPRDYEFGEVEEIDQVYAFGTSGPEGCSDWAGVARVLSSVSRGQVPAPESSEGEARKPERASGQPEESGDGPRPEADEEESVRAARVLHGLDYSKSVDLPAFLQPLMDTLPDEMTAVQRQQIAALLYTFQDVFAAPEGKLGQTDVVQHTIDTGDSRPIKIPPRRVPMHLRQVYDDEVRKMLEQGVIEPSTSSWASPVVLVRKKDGSYRFCVDYRSLNEVTKKDAYPLPRLDESIEAMAGAEWFHTLDLHSGYWQVAMDPADKEKTAFSTRMGLYQFRVMPFGLTNAPATFERLMEMVLNGMQWEQLQVYLDDVIIFGRTYLIAMLNLIQVFMRFRKAGLKMKVKKCLLFQRQVSFLGHIVGRDGVRCDPAKLEAVADWPHPTNVTEVKSFLGFATYYRRFIAHFSTVASPLTNLTRKDVEFEWTSACERAFRRLKSSLLSAPILAYPRMEGQYILDTDASNTGIGAVLSQMQQGEERVIAYGSKTLSRSQRNYCTTYKELLAVVKFCRHFKPYLWGKPFIVRTDHASLVWLKNFKEPEGMLARWIAALGEYQIEEIQHRPGIRHVNADVMSRRVPTRVCQRLDCPCCQPVRGLREQPNHQPSTGGTKGYGGARPKVRAPPVYLRKPKICADAQRRERGTQTEDGIAGDGDLTGPRPTSPVEQRKSGRGLLAAVSLQRHKRRPLIALDRRWCAGRRWGVKASSSRDDSQLATSPKFAGTTTKKKVTENCISDSVSDGLPGSVPAVCVPLRADRRVEQAFQDWVSCQTLDDWREKQDADPDIARIKQLLRTCVRRPGWRSVSSRSPELKAYWTWWDQLTLENGVLWRVDRGDAVGPTGIRQRLVTPPSMRQDLMPLIHDHRMSGHLGIRKTYARVKRRFCWPGCKKDVTRWCQRCHTCALIKPGGENKKAPLTQSLSGAPMERLALDIVGPLPETGRKHKYILVVSCYFTKYTEAYALTSKSTQEVAEVLVSQWFCRYGVCRQLHSDQGGEFTSKLIARICRLLNVDKTKTTPYRPSSDGLVERANRTVQTMLRAYVNANRDDWDDALPFVMMAYRSTEHESTGCSPNLLMYGREVETPLDVQYVPAPHVEAPVTCHIEYSSWLVAVLRRAHEFARRALGKAAERQKRNYDHGVSSRQFKAGDWVYLRDFVSSHTKLGFNWKGPYLVLGRRSDVTLALQRSPEDVVKNVHIDHVKRCLGDHPESWLVTSPVESARPAVEDSSHEVLEAELPIEPTIFEVEPLGELSPIGLNGDPETEVPVLEMSNPVLQPEEMTSPAAESRSPREMAQRQPEDVVDPARSEGGLINPSGVAEVADQQARRTRCGRVVRAPERLIAQL